MSIEQGKEPPEEYYNQPDIPPHLGFIWLAFFDLSTERQIGMGVGPIPRSKIREYARELGIDDNSESFDRFTRIIHALDDEYVRRANEPSKKKNEPVEIRADDVHGMKRLFANLGAHQKSAKRITKKPTKAITNGRDERRSDDHN